MEASKYVSHFYGQVQGVVIGDNNTVTFVFQSGHQLTVPFLAPPRPPYVLVGRDELLRDLKRRLFAGGSLALSALNGLPGVGKTALAIDIANDHEVLEHFPGGVLWARLGHDANDADILSRLSAWGIALGIPRPELEKLNSVESWAEAIHASIGVRRMLLMVDDAWKPEAALAFKLGGPNCAHIVTTRLPEVAMHFAGEGMTMVRELDTADGLKLLAQLAPAAVSAEPKEAEKLVQSVGGLPLALILIGKYLWKEGYEDQLDRIHEALEHLQQAEERLQLSQPQSPLERHPSLPEGAWISVQAVIAVSDSSLDGEARHALQTLSVFPAKPNSFSKEAALEVSATPSDTLKALSDYGLLENSGQNRYTLHQTIADYARTRLIDQVAYKRMSDFFISYVEAHKKEYGVIEQETSNILAALDLAFSQGMQANLVRGINAFYHFMEARGLYKLAENQLERAMQVAKSLGDTSNLTTTLLNMGKLANKQSNYAQAKMHLQEALVLAQNINNKQITSSIFNELGVSVRHYGDLNEEENFYKEGLDIAHEIDDYEMISLLLQNMGDVATKRGDLLQAKEYLQESLVIIRRTGDHERTSRILSSLGVLAVHQGDLGQADKCYQEALELARKIGHREGILVILTNLNAVAFRRADYDRAREYLHEALGIAHEIGSRERISYILMLLGAGSSHQGDYEQAENYLKEGLSIAREIGSRDNIFYLLTNMGEVSQRRGNLEASDEYFREALEVARNIGQRWPIGYILNALGELCIQQKNPTEANVFFLEALEIAREGNIQELVGCALYGLGKVALAQGNIAEALQQGQEGLAILDSIEHYAAEEVKQWISTLSLVEPLD